MYAAMSTPQEAVKNIEQGAYGTPTKFPHQHLVYPLREHIPAFNTRCVTSLCCILVDA